MTPRLKNSSPDIGKEFPRLSRPGSRIDGGPEKKRLASRKLLIEEDEEEQIPGLKQQPYPPLLKLSTAQMLSEYNGEAGKEEEEKPEEL